MNDCKKHNRCINQVCNLLYTCSYYVHVLVTVYHSCNNPYNFGSNMSPALRLQRKANIKVTKDIAVPPNNIPTCIIMTVL